jgi:hypothetical protein
VIDIVDQAIDRVISRLIGKSNRSSDWSIDRLKVVDRVTKMWIDHHES